MPSHAKSKHLTGGAGVSLCHTRNMVGLGLSSWLLSPAKLELNGLRESTVAYLMMTRYLWSSINIITIVRYGRDFRGYPDHFFLHQSEPSSTGFCRPTFWLSLCWNFSPWPKPPLRFSPTEFLLQCSLSNPCHNWSDYIFMQWQYRISFIVSVWHLI
jgi:hypothetical protein